MPSAPPVTSKRDAHGASLRRAVRLVPTAYLTVIGIGTAILWLPCCRSGVGDAPAGLAAMFTAVSTVCVTGLSTVDVATYWSPIGHVVVMLLIQVGGLGIMTLATLLSLVVRGRIGLQDSLVAQTETHAVGAGDVRRVVRRAVSLVMYAEAGVAIFVAARLFIGYGYSPGKAIWHGIFHSVSAVNNVGYSLNSDNIMGFVSDAWICWPLCAGIIAGGLGYPVVYELKHAWRRPRGWTVHTRLTVYGTAVLLVVGTLAFLAFEWSNARTLGPLDGWGKTVAGVTGGVVPRTGGYNSVDYGAVTEQTKVLYYVLMFIGGGSAGTAGGIKVSTFFLLAFVIWAEVRGESHVVIGHRRIPAQTQRQALTISLLAVGAVFAGTVALVVFTTFHLDDIVFEVISAFSTVGLSTGITPTLPVPAQGVIMLLMFLGRVGTVTAISALALRTQSRRYQLPEEKPLVG